MIPRLHRAGKDGRRGSAAVEWALCLLVVVAFIIGAADIAKVMFLHQGLVERARAGVAWAATRPFNASEIQNYVVYNSTAGGTSPVFYNLAVSQVTATLLDGNTTRARVEVRITNYPFEFWMPWLSGVFTARPVVAVLSHEPSLP